MKGEKMEDEIIVAIATAQQVGAISIVRVSGTNSIAFVQKFFSGNIVNKETRTMHYGYILDDNKKIDEVLVSIFKGKKTFTGEEMVEINCHGGILITQRVLEVCLKNGASLASRGEFSKRAFLNGRIDLSQAEAIHDLISAKTEYTCDLAMQGLQGNIYHFISDLQEQLIQIITQIEVTIDYPEYDDIEQLTATSLLPKSKKLQESMHKIMMDSKRVALLKEGIQTVIIGRPNVGKSSLLNALLQEDKAIVTDIAGTTRDVVEGDIIIDDVILHIMDTAGIRQTEDKIEQIGVDKAHSLIEKADVVFVVLDGSQPLTKEDQQLLNSTKDKKRILIINKNDREKCFTLEDSVSICAKNSTIQPLIDKIKKDFYFEELLLQKRDILVNVRQRDLLHKANKSLSQAIDAMTKKVPVDLIVVELYDCWSYIKEIVGENAKEDLLDELFKRFCIGK